MDWGQLALFVVVIVVLWLVGRFLRAAATSAAQAGMVTVTAMAAGTGTDASGTYPAIW